jgi:hypothetical protein
MSHGFPEAPLKTHHPCTIHSFSTDYGKPQIPPCGWRDGLLSNIYSETDLPQGQVTGYPPSADVPGSHSSARISGIYIRKYWAPGDYDDDDNETTNTIAWKESSRPTEVAYLNVKNKLQIVPLCHCALYYQKVLTCIKNPFSIFFYSYGVVLYLYQVNKIERKSTTATQLFDKLY